MKRILLLLAGYALYRWWTREPPEQPEGPPIALPPPQKRKPAERRATN
jgi:hypothetical protein